MGPRNRKPGAGRQPASRNDASLALSPIIDYLSLVVYLCEFPAEPGAMLTAIAARSKELLGRRVARWSVNIAPEEAIAAFAGAHRKWEGCFWFRRPLDHAWSPDELANLRGNLLTYLQSKDYKRYREYGIEEDDWSVRLDRDNVVAGHEMGPQIHVGINLNKLPVEKLPEVPAYLRDVIALIGRFVRPASGFIDIADVRETVLGRDYGGTSHLMVHFQRQLSKRVWLEEGQDRIHKLRGVFWGNLLSEQMLRKLGGNQFLEACRSRGTKGYADHVRVFEDGSALVTLSPKVKDLMFPHYSLMPWTIEFAAWLHRQFAHAGLLPGTDKPHPEGV